jgi:hypothetical protein
MKLAWFGPGTTVTVVSYRYGSMAVVNINIFELMVLHEFLLLFLLLKGLDMSVCSSLMVNRG